MKTMALVKERRRRRWRLVAAAAVLVAGVWFSRAWWLRETGEFLVKSEAPQKADVVVVLAGDGYGHRLLRAVELVRQGHAPIIVVDGPYTAYEHNEAELAVNWAVRRGVPREILHPLPMPVRSTVDEVKRLNGELERRGVKKALVVTSNYHTRRVRAVLNRFGLKSIQYRVISAPDEFFDPQNWWESRDAKKTVLLEYSKLMNWWLE
jgi:uncharacterized SAM-binding protein YcdF (DUF218 family)